MPGGGGNPFPTEGHEQRIAAAIDAHRVLMRQIAGHVIREETEHEQ